jgi:Flp pilus assembly protein TadD
MVPDSRLPTPSRRRPFLWAIILMLIGSAGTVLIWRTSSKPQIRRLGPLSLYENTREEVTYVGDAACARCHKEIAATFRQHPMGQSLFPIAEAPVPGPEARTQPALFEFNGLVYAVLNRGNRVIHQEMRRNAAGTALYQKEAEVQYALGSGRQAVSYLIERDGFLFESPITWYAHDHKWGLSPGYEARASRFDRPILSDCLFCHANRAERTSSANNRYRAPVFFQGHAIGCERCHGPGELHVKRPRNVDGKDVTIVNPADLQPSLRDAVCEQCHLIGPRRIARVDARSEDFRPGFEFYQFWSMFVPASTSGTNKFASQAEQMHESRCFRQSEGQLGCISCHDPHVMPTPEEKPAYYRDRCLGCHADQDCRAPTSARLGRNPANDCIGCHMPRSPSSNNTHVATTNHRVPRNQEGAAGPAEHVQSENRAELSLVHFHRDRLTDQERALTERDRGIALCRSAGAAGAAMALPLLEAAVAARPDDLSALESQGEVLGRLGRAEEGLAAYKSALVRDPTRQTALEGAAHLAFKAGRNAESVELWKRAIAVNPWRTDYHADMALAAVENRDWRTAAAAGQEALRLNPSLLKVRAWLVQSYLHLGGREAARKELELLLSFDPPDRDVLIRRFASLKAPP